MTPMVWHQGIHDKVGMQRMRWEGVEGAPGLVPWIGKGRSGTGVFCRLPDACGNKRNLNEM